MIEKTAELQVKIIWFCFINKKDISTIIKFTSGRGWGMTPQGLSYKAFNLPSHPDHKYIWLKGGDLNH